MEVGDAAPVVFGADLRDYLPRFNGVTFSNVTCFEDMDIGNSEFVFFIIYRDSCSV